MRQYANTNAANAQPPDGKAGWLSFDINVVNNAAAVFHLIQCIICIAIVAWLDSKSPHSKYLSIKTTAVYTNATTGQNYSVDTWTNSSMDFLNKKSGVFPLHRTVNVWHKIDDAVDAGVFAMAKIRAMSSDFYIETRDLSSGEIDVRYIIVAFFALSGVFQVVEGYFFDFYYTPRLRFIEYSVSASIMIIAIAVESGIRDLYTIEMMFILIWATQIFGLFADALSVLSERFDIVYQIEPIYQVLGPWSWMLPHFAGWATCVGAYAPILDNFFESNKASDTKAPGFVNVIVFLQFGLFSCFGFVQLYSLVKRTYIILGQDQQQYPESRALIMGSATARNMVDAKLVDLAENVERMYILLSFTAKTLLAWLVLSPIITDAA